PSRRDQRPAHGRRGHPLLILATPEPTPAATLDHARRSPRPHNPDGVPPMSAPARLAVLLSGGGRTLANLLDQIGAGTLPATIELVIASRESPGAQRARDAGIPVQVIPGVIPAARLGALLREHRIDWAILAGYLKLVQVPPGYEGRIVNIHPALLPSFGGAGMYGERVHPAVLPSGATESGCTVHLVDE